MKTGPFFLAIIVGTFVTFALNSAYYMPQMDMMAEWMKKFNGSAYAPGQEPSMMWYLLMSLLAACLAAIVVLPRQLRGGSAFLWGMITGVLASILSSFGWIMTFPFFELWWALMEAVVQGLIYGLTSLAMAAMYNRIAASA